MIRYSYCPPINSELQMVASYYLQQTLKCSTLLFNTAVISSLFLYEIVCYYYRNYTRGSRLTAVEEPLHSNVALRHVCKALSLTT